MSLPESDDDSAWFVGVDDDWEWDEPASGEALRATLASAAWISALTPECLVGLHDGDGGELDADSVRSHAVICHGRATALVAQERFDDVALLQLHGALTDLSIIAATAAGRTAQRSTDLIVVASALALAAGKTGDMLRHRITPRRDGSYRVRWSDAERTLVRTAIDRLDGVIDSGHEALARLYPAAYGDDDQRSTEFAALAHPELIDSRRAAFAHVRDSLDRSVMTEEQLHALLRSINDVRLVLGTQLDVTEDDSWLPSFDSQEAADARTYHLLTGLLGDVIWALQRSL